MTIPTKEEVERWWDEAAREAKRIEREMTKTQMTRVTRWFFFTQPFRRWLVRFATRRDTDTRLDRWITDRLYPIDADITFAADDEVQS